MSAAKLIAPRITGYAIAIDALDDLVVEERKGIGANGDRALRWAITNERGAWTRDRNGFVLEPIPSERDDAYIAHARWTSADEAFVEVNGHVLPWLQANRRAS